MGRVVLENTRVGEEHGAKQLPQFRNGVSRPHRFAVKLAHHTSVMASVPANVQRIRKTSGPSQVA